MSLRYITEQDMEDYYDESRRLHRESLQADFPSWTAPLLPKVQATVGEDNVVTTYEGTEGLLPELP